MSGMPCGPKAAFASKGYFAKQRNRRGRQWGRVLATRYEEVVVDRLFDGKTQLNKALQPLMQAAEQTLALDERQRERTLVRLDAGGGSVDDVNWLLGQGYQVHGKDYSSARAQRLAASVQYWVDDPKVEGRQVGWVRLPATEYVRPVRRIAVRCGTMACCVWCVMCSMSAAFWSSMRWIRWSRLCSIRLHPWLPYSLRHCRG